MQQHRRISKILHWVKVSRFQRVCSSTWFHLYEAIEKKKKKTQERKTQAEKKIPRKEKMAETKI